MAGPVSKKERKRYRQWHVFFKDGKEKVEKVEELLSLRKIGFSLPELGAMYGVDHTTVLHQVQKRLKLNPLSFKMGENRNQVKHKIRLFIQGKTNEKLVTELADSLNVSVSELKEFSLLSGIAIEGKRSRDEISNIKNTFFETGKIDTSSYKKRSFFPEKKKIEFKPEIGWTKKKNEPLTQLQIEEKARLSRLEQRRAEMLKYR